MSESVSGEVCEELAHDIDLGSDDVITKCIALLTAPNAFLDHYLDLCARSGSDRIKQALALFLQAQFKLHLPIKAAYLDRRYGDAMLNSLVANQAYELLSIRCKEQINEVN